MVTPGVTVRRMFENASKASDGIEGGGKASIIVSQFLLDLRSRAAIPKPAPSLARRVGNHWPGSTILTGVALDRPWVYFRQSGVDAIRFNKERRNHSC